MTCESSAADGARRSSTDCPATEHIANTLGVPGAEFLQSQLSCQDP